jgi:protein subunit release factor B
MIRKSLFRCFARFIIPQAEITEKLTSGWGPGGQSVNKSNNCVCLTHIPTGISVKVHQSRDLYVNKGIAYKRLAEKVELQLKGPASKLGQAVVKVRKQKDRRRRRHEKKAQEEAVKSPNQID